MFVVTGHYSITSSAVSGNDTVTSKCILPSGSIAYLPRPRRDYDYRYDTVVVDRIDDSVDDSVDDFDDKGKQYKGKQFGVVVDVVAKGNLQWPKKEKRGGREKR